MDRVEETGSMAEGEGELGGSRCQSEGLEA